MSGNPGIERFELNVPGGHLGGVVRRGGGDALVFLHAGICDHRSWCPTLTALTDAGIGPIVAYDRRGYGDSRTGTQPFLHVDDLLGIVDALGASRVWLVGSSAGGQVALDAAYVHPSRVAGCMLIAPEVAGAPPPALLDPGTQAISDEIDAATAGGNLDQLNRLAARLWLDGPTSSEGRVSGERRHLLLRMNATILRRGTAEATGTLGAASWTTLDRIRCPVTVVWGDLDVPFLQQRYQQLAAQLPDCPQTHVVTGTAHLPYLEAPEALAEIIATATGHKPKPQHG